MVSPRRRSPWFAAALCTVLGACGGGSGTTPTPLPSNTPQPCTQSVLLQVQGGVSPVSVGAAPFTITVPGRVDVTVDWTLASSSIGVYIVQVAVGCDLEQLSAQACNFVLASPPSAVKPRKVSVPASAGPYQLLVANFSSNQESVTGQVVLSLGTCPAFGASPATVIQDRAKPELSVRRLDRLLQARP
jgi:hypothetical protein